MSATMPVRVLRLPAVLERLGGISKTTLWRWRRAGRFIAPIKLAPGSIGWIESELDAWLENKRRERDQPAAR